MESTTKNRQSLAVLKKLIEKGFGSQSVPTGEDFYEELTEGWFNVAYKIRLADGQQVVLKIAPPANVPVLTREVNMMRAELEAMRLISTYTNVPVPKVLFEDLSHELVDADLFFMEYIDADNFGIVAQAGQLPEEVIGEGNRQLGVLNSQINSITGSHFGPLLGPGFATWSEAFVSIIDDTLQDADRINVEIGWDHDEIRAMLLEQASVLDEVTKPQLVELDLWAKNSMIKDGKIVAVLDHERAIYGDPLMEAGLTGLDIAFFGDPSSFKDGFGLGELTQNQRNRRRLYTLYLALVMVVETKFRGHTDTMIYDFGRSQLDTLMEHFGHTRK